MTFVPPWLVYGLEDAGVTEIPGPEHSDVVLKYLSTVDNIGSMARSRDETPWCSAAVNAWMRWSINDGTDNALARSWIRWGRPEEALGAVCVIKRRKRGADRRTGSRGGYHVGLFLGRSRGGVVLWSGNASNRVGADWYSGRRYDEVAMRMPGCW